MYSRIELTERISSFTTPVAPILKAMPPLALLLGAYDLLWYLAGERLSLPLNIPGLITLFIAVGVLAVLVVGIAGLYILMGALFTRHLSDGPFADLLNCGYDGTRLLSLRSQLRHFITRYSLPQLGLGCMILGEWTASHGWAIGVCLLVIPGMLGYEAVALKVAKDGPPRSRKAAFALWALLSFSWTMFHFFTWCSAILFVAILRYRDFLATYAGLGLAVVVCTVLNTGALLVRYRSDDTAGLSPKSCAPFALLVIFGASLVPPVSAQTAVFILDRLGLTGVSVRYIYAPEKGDGALPGPLVDRCVNERETCISRPVTVLLDAGSTIQVRIASSTDNEIYRLPAEKIALSWLPVPHAVAPNSERSEKAPGPPQRQEPAARAPFSARNPQPAGSKPHD
jgi:hypothetical protein